MNTKQLFWKTWVLVCFLIIGKPCLFAQEVQPNRVPAFPELLEVVQPDGYKLRIYLRGDERRSWRMTADGYLLLTNKQGFYCYARETCSGQVKPSKYKAKNKEDRTAVEQRFLKKQAQNRKLKFNINENEVEN